MGKRVSDPIRLFPLPRWQTPEPLIDVRPGMVVSQCAQLSLCTLFHGLANVTHLQVAAGLSTLLKLMILCEGLNN